MKKKLDRTVIGIDEVGRGPLAGPVTVAAVMASARFWRSTAALSVPLRDSKRLSPRQREVWFRHVRAEATHGTVHYALASVFPRVIDRVNITRAANLAATRAFKRLVSSMGYRVSGMSVILDGGLYLNKIRDTKYKILNTNTVIKGDERFPSIMLASIVAKVTRDRAMKRLHVRFPVYGFDKHKGYGTKRHLQVLKKRGPSEAHRLTFVHARHTIKR
ncbi:ribonuclease HII [Candidatus Jorgensenbacteria bacterium CG10_big_fil_rev_8_21_14_0_10_54_38]|uniref:Ribonuclease n=2 Tax=Candidatus Joergenseniibacteriota TaxID=1752739 RepID=A0A2M6WGP9_9BACT|nr:MAG: ribonuclease HII [Candidatus Jorgensenbacteria bacterium CG23_combo_of_CG06-09_8_20_14_all_54_14]PIT91937.1 MAG: ribonuclease HII [Candidatus Jorgensenbacteria bacterium CG10_big_fil_rev_8_21_14_0_10_54_38]